MEARVDHQPHYNIPIKISILLGYGSGFFGYGFVTQMFGAYFVFYTTSVLQMNSSIIGLLIALGIIWDAVSDPIMGYISDNTRSKYGKRHIYIIMGALLLTVANLVLWHVSVELSDIAKFIWIGTFIFIFKTSVTIFATPYSALGAEMSNDYQERVKIQAIKTVFFLTSLILVSAICMFVFFKPTTEYPIGQLNPKAYSAMAITGSIIMLITGLWTYFSTLDFKIHQKINKDRNILGSLKASFVNKDFRQVFLGYLATNTASAVISVIGLHTFTYTFRMNNTEIGLIFGGQFLVSILTQPVWTYIAHKIDKRKTVLLCLIISMLGCLMLFGFVLANAFVREAPLTMLIYAFVVGFGTSGLYTLPLAMVADTVDMEEHRIGVRSEGMYYGLLNFGYKLSQSIAILLLGFLLDIIRFDASVYIQKPSTELHLGIVLSLGSFAAFGAAYLAYRHYSLNFELVTRVQKEIEARKSK